MNEQRKINVNHEKRVEKVIDKRNINWWKRGVKRYSRRYLRFRWIDRNCSFVHFARGTLINTLNINNRKCQVLQFILIINISFV